MASGRTLYHVVFAELLRERAPPGFRITPELRLATEPQQADFLLLRQEGAERHDDQARTLRQLWPLLPGDTLVEYKSPTRPLREGDVARLLGYGGQYWSMECLRLKHRLDLALVLVVPSVTRRLEAELAAFDWEMTSLGGGYWRLDSRPFPGVVVVVDDVSATERDELLQLVGHRTIRTEEQDAWLLTHTVFGPQATEMEKLEGYLELIEKIPAHVRLRGMKPEQRLEGLSPEERLEGLSPEERLLALDDETLRLLPTEFIEKQPAPIREAIRRRIGSH